MLTQAGTQERCLGELSARLLAAGYDGPALQPILKRGILNIDGDMLPALIRRCHEDGSPVARLIAFWLLLEPVEQNDLQALLGKEVVAALGQLHLVEPEGSQLRARVSLYPCMGRHFFADPVLPMGLHNGLPWLTLPGYTLALSAPRARGKQVLDIGTGTGVQAIFNTSHGQRSWGTDEHPLAPEYFRLNALVNGLEGRLQLVTRESDVPGYFQLITGRLPSAPASSGEDAPGVRQLAGRLRAGGTLALAVRHFTPDRPLLERVEHWLGGAAGWGLAQLNYSSTNLNEGVTFRATLGEEQRMAQAGYQAADEALVFIRRLEKGRPGWRLEANISPPNEAISDLVESWLDAQDRFPDAGWQASWQKWRPHWSYIERLFVDPRSGFSLARYQKGFAPAALDPSDTFLMDQIDGVKTASHLVEAYAGRFEQSLDAARPEVGHRLAKLCRRVMIQ